jgi:hypothetical protein
VFRERTAGESKVTSKVYVEYLRHLLRLRMAVLPARFLKFAAVAIGVTTGWNFWMNKVFSWSAPQPLRAPAAVQRRAAGA